MSSDDIFVGNKNNKSWPVEVTNFLAMMKFVAGNAKKYPTNEEKITYLDSIITKCEKNNILDNKYYVACYLYCKYVLRFVSTVEETLKIAMQRINKFADYVTDLNWHRRSAQFTSHMKSIHRLIGMIYHRQQDYDNAYENLLAASHARSLSSAGLIYNMIWNGKFSQERIFRFCDVIDGWVMGKNERKPVRKINFKEMIEEFKKSEIVTNAIPSPKEAEVCVPIQIETVIVHIVIH